MTPNPIRVTPSQARRLERNLKKGGKRPKGNSMAYKKYGDEWENEVMKNPKKFIVGMLRRVAMERDSLEAAQQSGPRAVGTACKKHDIDFCAECFPTTSRR